MYEISVVGLPETIWLVSDDEAADARARARHPGRIWSHGEVADLRARRVSTEDAVKIAEAKLLLNGGALLWLRPGKQERLAREAEQAVMGYEE